MVPAAPSAAPPAGGPSAAVVRPVRADDLAAVAALHVETFPGYFLTSLGPAFLTRLYRRYDSTGDVGLVAEDERGRIVGFVFGTRDLGALYGRFYRRELPAIVAIVTKRFAQSAEVRSQVLARTGHLVGAVRALVRGRSAAADLDGERPDALLVSIGVSPSAQGSPVAARLTRAFLDELAVRGARDCMLSVLTDNPRGIRFYEREGWTRVRQEGTEYVYRIDTGRPATATDADTGSGSVSGGGAAAGR